ncbi:MAG: peptidylprolyl isomerase [Treponema sp.]|nr:MAG: peptidylprolyl isomerase [Treponema sp.]
MVATTAFIISNNPGNKQSKQERLLEELLMEELNEFKDTAADGLYAIIKTAKGMIYLQLYYEKTPMTVCNFVGLAEGKFTVTEGKPFYDGLKFHRVIADFMIQGGDPLGNGTGGPGYAFPDEFVSDLRHDAPGTLSMANAGPNTNGSQFFITHKETPWLDDHHTVFGKVVKGQNVVDAIQQGDIIEKITILRKGNKAKSFEVSQEKFEQLQKEVAANNKKEAQKAMEAIQQNAREIIQKKWPNAKKTGNGLYYVVTKAGTGSQARSGQTLTMKYKGSLLANGKVFDDSDMHEPLQFQAGAGKVIPGFDQQALEMKVGECRTIIIPPELAYGNRGVGNGLIPPNSYLVFELELLSAK